MLNFPALDVALGLILIYFLLSVICSTINEAIASKLKWRAKDLERALKQLLGDHEPAFREHPLIKTMLDPKRVAQVEQEIAGRIAELKRRTPGISDAEAEAQAQARPTKTPRYPSYIPSRTFTAALLGDGYHELHAAIANPRKIEETIDAIPNAELKNALVALYHHAQGDAVVFRRGVERWYDDTMERVSGWYRRRVQLVILALAIGTALVLNADTLQMAKHLWTNPSARAAVVNEARNEKPDSSGGKGALTSLDHLPLPLGWHLASARHDPQGFPIYEKWSMVWALLAKLVGLTLTAAALLLGAPFWFDVLSKIARLRNSGAPPPASDAVRHGEGEETRGGPSTVLAQAAPGGTTVAEG